MKMDMLYTHKHELTQAEAAMKVLVVEDNPIIQRMFSRAIQLAGITVVVANNGSLAVETALREKPDIILMDVMMPEMNGLDALRTLKANEQTKTIPVVMLTAYEDDKLLTSAMNAGATRYLVKSNLDPQQVIDIIREVVGSAPAPTE